MLPAERARYALLEPTDFVLQHELDHATVEDKREVKLAIHLAQLPDQRFFATPTERGAATALCSLDCL